MDEVNFKSSNVNAKWIDNILENIKNSEQQIKLTKEGFMNLIDYNNIPPERREYELVLSRYNNLKTLTNELILLITDSIPIISEEVATRYHKRLKNIRDKLENRKIFLRIRYDINKRISSCEVTSVFDITLREVETIRENIINELSPMLFIKDHLVVNKNRPRLM